MLILLHLLCPLALQLHFPLYVFIKHPDLILLIDCNCLLIKLSNSSLLCTLPLILCGSPLQVNDEEEFKCKCINLAFIMPCKSDSNPPRSPKQFYLYFIFCLSWIFHHFLRIFQILFLFIYYFL